MRIASVLRGTLFATIAVAGIDAHAYHSSPPTARTMAPAIAAIPAENSCTGCHGGSTLNSGGNVQLLAVPTAYMPGVTYTLTLRLSSSQTASDASRRWGFQITAVKMLDGASAGDLSNVSGQGTRVLNGSGSFASRQYIEVDTENHTGVASPVEWQVNWTAPAAGAGPVTLYFTGLAGNGGGSSGDYVYTGTVAIAEASTPVEATTWGAVKSLYER